MGFFDDFFDTFFRHIFLSKKDILTDRRIEEAIVLEYHSDTGSERILSNRTDIDSIDEDMS